jgi:hypothetical protein
MLDLPHINVASDERTISWIIHARDHQGRRMTSFQKSLNPAAALGILFKWLSNLIAISSMNEVGVEGGRVDHCLKESRDSSECNNWKANLDWSVSFPSHTAVCVAVL